MLDIPRDRITRLYQFLGDYTELRSPIKRQINDQPWHYWLRDLPNYPTIEVSKQVGDDFVVRIQRPKTTIPSAPPPILEEWVERGWENPFQNLKVRSSINKIVESNTLTIKFEDDLSRVEAWKTWQKLWREWAEAEKPLRRALSLYEKLFELRGRLEREGERLELILGDGILSWRSPEGAIHHPVLLQKVQLDFDPKVPEFRIVESDQAMEFYSAVLRSVPELEAASIARIRVALAEGDYHPLDEEETSGFFRYVAQQLSSKGVYQDKAAANPNTDYPVMGRDRVLFLRERNQGFAKAIEAILEKLPETELPEPLLSIVGIEKQKVVVETQSKVILPGQEPEEVLFSKSWNQEQLQIAERLDRHSGVVVQGPPGTGKTHTIANLVGHLLAQGKNILITAHTTKALRVVREKVVKELQPLCVSVLDSDQESKKQLEDSVERIVERLSNSSIGQLKAEGEKLELERKKIIAEIEQLRQEILEARGYEYREIVVAGKGYTPSDAARKIQSELGQHDWIPGVVSQGQPMPLSAEELSELYSINSLLTAEAEFELEFDLPDPKSLLSPQIFNTLLNKAQHLERLSISPRNDLWETQSPTPIGEKLLGAASDLAKTVQPILGEESWVLEAIWAGQQGSIHRELWDKLLQQIEKVVDLAAHAQDSIIEHSPRLSSKIALEEQKNLAGEIAQHLANGGNLGFLTMLTKGAWKNLIEEVSTNGNKAPKAEHFKAIQIVASLEIARRELVKRWDYLVAARGGIKLTGQVEPERLAAQYSQTMGNYLDFSKTIGSYVSTLEESGLRWKAFLAEEPPNPSSQGELLRLAHAVTTRLKPIVEAKVVQTQKLGVSQQLAQAIEYLNHLSQQASYQGGLVRLLNKTLSEHDVKGYREVFGALVEVVVLRSVSEQRKRQLLRLGKAAPDWAAAIRNRSGLHGKAELPGDAQKAWIYKQLKAELERRSQTSLQILQDRLTELTQRAQQLTAQLIERKAWMYQLQRTNLSQQQALFGWLDTVRKMGKRTGKRVPKLLQEAARLMNECRTAVPVWIMPLSRVVEQFDPRNTQFDVVIVDEASQCGVMGLVTFAMAKKVVIVGDHEQVSPDAVGEEVARTEQLIGEHLQDIPNKHLYDGKTSIYDLARQSFGGMITLLEHYRCVPDIIQFSNALSYQGRIKPLRETSEVLLKPHVVPHRVQGVRSVSGKTNKREAEEIVALIQAAVAQPEYQNKTFGVISLLGEEQVIEIDRLLRQSLPEDVYVGHRILCGTAAQFQGDERDVMFLTMVDSSKQDKEGPLIFSDRDGTRQRYNVAASRAKDQMWVVYSLDPQVDLKPGDLRRRLIEYALDPAAITRTLEAQSTKTESEFERQVLERLIKAGYRVITQWKVGSYRIDMVVEGGGKLLAVECDGDRYHSIEHLPNDMARQAVLERLGWRFVRIRGSEFFRDPEAAMKPVFERLERLSIAKDGLLDLQPQKQLSSLYETIVRNAAELLMEKAREPSRFLESTPTL